VEEASVKMDELRISTRDLDPKEIDPNYSPRKIIRMVLLGMREEVLSSDFIWLCTLCYTCYARCPQNVKFTDVMGALRNMAVREGYVHPSFLKQIDGIDKFTQQLRHDMLMKAFPNKKKDKAFDISDFKETVTRSLRG